MKRLLILAAAMGMTAAALGQGKLTFANNSAFATPADRLVYGDSSSSFPLVGTTFVAQLYYGPQGTSEWNLKAVAPTAAFRAPTTVSPGTWVGGNRTLVGIAAGQTATLQVRVWDSAAFASYEAAMTAGGRSGRSGLFEYTVPPDGSPSSAYFMENFRGFVLYSDPPMSLPWISVHPQSQSVVAGSRVELSVTAWSVYPLTYQWYCNGMSVAGGTGDVLILNNVQTTNAGNYEVRITNNSYWVTSAPAILDLTPLELQLNMSGGGPQLTVPRRFHGTFEILTSSNLTHWNTWATHTGLFTNWSWIDSTSSGADARFYRVRTAP